MSLRFLLLLSIATYLPAQFVSPMAPFFESNVGQADADVKFLYRGDLDSLTIKATSLNWFRYPTSIQFVGGSESATARPVGILPAKLNIFHGSDPSKWQRNIPLSSAAAIDGIYPGVNVTYSIHRRAIGGLIDQLKYTVVVHPGSNPNIIRLKFPGFGHPMNAIGAVMFTGGAMGGVFSITQPIAYHLNSDQRMPVNVTFRIESDETLSVAVGNYPSTAPLYLEWTMASIPDPLTNDFRRGGFINSATFRDDFGLPGPHGLCSSGRCNDIWVGAIDESRNLKWLTLLGGSGDENIGTVVQQGSDIFLKSYSDSKDFPITPNGVRATFPGQQEIVLARLSGETGDLKASTYPGTGTATTGPIVVDSAANFYLSGDKAPGPYTVDRKPQPYALKWDSNSNRILYIADLPVGAGAIALDNLGQLIFAGQAQPGLPTTAGAFQRDYSSTLDYYVGVLSADGSRLTYGTYASAFGSPGEVAQVQSMQLTSSETVWITLLGSESRTATLAALNLTTGKMLTQVQLATTAYSSELLRDPAGGVWATFSPNGRTLPISPNALQSMPCRTSRVLAHFTQDGVLDYSTYLPEDYSGASLSIDASGRLYAMAGGQPSPPKILDLTPPASAQLACALTLPYGGLVTLVGAGFGPVYPVSAMPDANGNYPTELQGVRVSINAKLVPVVSVGRGWVTIHAPYSITDETVRLETPTGQAQLQSPASYKDPFQLSLFSIDGTYTGQAAAVNQDGTLNSQEHPAHPGTVVALYGTGGGEYQMDLPLGAVATSAVGLRLTVQARIGPVTPYRTTLDREVAVEYSGTAPGLINAVNQVNVRLPATLDLKGRVAIGVKVMRPCQPYCFVNDFYGQVWLWVQ